MLPASAAPSVVSPTSARPSDRPDARDGVAPRARRGRASTRAATKRRCRTPRPAPAHRSPRASPAHRSPTTTASPARSSSGWVHPRSDGRAPAAANRAAGRSIAPAAAVIGRAARTRPSPSRTSAARRTCTADRLPLPDDRRGALVLAERAPGRDENRRPAPFGSEPSGRSIGCAAAAATGRAHRARRRAAGSTSWNRAHAAENPERPPRSGPRVRARRRARGSCTRRPRRRSGASAGEAPARAPPFAAATRCAQALANRAYVAAASDRSAAAGTRPSGDPRRRRRPRPAPSSPAKSGSHSAMVEPMSAPTFSPDASIACRKAMPSGICDARMMTSGRAAARSSHDAAANRAASGCRSRGATTGIAGDAAVACARRPRPSWRSRRSRRRSRRAGPPTAFPSRGASSVAAKAAEFDAQVRAAGADAEDHRQAAPGQPVRDRARLPVQEAGPSAASARRDREVRRVRADDDLDAAAARGRP